MTILMQLKNRFRLIRTYILFKIYRGSLKKQVNSEDVRYQKYLDAQLLRTLLKKKHPIQEHTKLLINKLSELSNLQGKKVLCVGCRNKAELEYFQGKGVNQVVGIDLYSEDPKILVMDMHHMTFPGSSFDVVYSAHSLEHAYDVNQVAAEFVRVAKEGGLIVIEVPVHYQGVRTADLVDIENLANLHDLFEPNIGNVLWTDEQESLTPTNAAGSSIIRTIFSVRKNLP
jgi:SAM-dependent methyltransferase